MRSRTLAYCAYRLETHIIYAKNNQREPVSLEHRVYSRGLDICFIFDVFSCLAVVFVVLVRCLLDKLWHNCINTTQGIHYITLYIDFDLDARRPNAAPSLDTFYSARNSPIHPLYIYFFCNHTPSELLHMMMFYIFTNLLLHIISTVLHIICCKYIYIVSK